MGKILSKPYYHNSLRKIIIAFGTIFDKLSIDRADVDGNFIKNIKVPLQYFPKEKFVQRIQHDKNLDDRAKVDTLPSMGFEMTALTYAPERKTNTLRRLHTNWNDARTTQSMFNRVPYDLEFALYIATRKLDDSFRIVEQILPYFTPEFNVKIEDMEAYDIETNVPFVLNDTSFDIEADGSFDERRTVLWTLIFSAKAYLYSDSNEISLINKTIIDINEIDTHDFFEGYRARIDPPDATVNDDYEIIETVVTHGQNTYDFTIETGSNVIADLETN